MQNGLLTIASLLFYLVGSGTLISLVLLVIAITYVCGLLLRVPTVARGALWFGVGSQILLLGYFKYANFFVEQASLASVLLGGTEFPWREVALPIGLSFFTFQAVSYLVDIARNEQEPLKNPLDVTLFISMFPQLIAGPIVRYGDVAAQIRARTISFDDLAAGAVRFVYGLTKKLVLADGVATIADAAFGLRADELTGAAAWAGALAYSCQIYFDFSAYSDMAIGLGRMTGFRFPENFERPYSAVSITDFWRRWHQTLSFWFRDYVYIPLGGSRGSPMRTLAHLWAVFLLSGLWHGAAWTFVAWGAYHGAWLSIERLGRKRKPLLPVGVRRATTFAIVVVGFMLFRADSLTQAGHFFAKMAWPFDAQTMPYVVTASMSHRNTLLLVVGLLTTAIPGSFVVGRWLSEAPSTWRVRLARMTVMTFGATASAIEMASSSFSPFIYFRF